MNMNSFTNKLQERTHLYLHFKNIVERVSTIIAHFSLLEIVSGSLKVGALSAPFLEYSLHLRAAAAAFLALSFTSSSATTMHPSDTFTPFYPTVLNDK